jgi:hypothetical protein
MSCVVVCGCVWCACCVSQRQTMRANPAGNAVRFDAFEHVEEVVALPWHFKGKLLVDVNQPLLTAADAKGRSKSITLVSGLFDLGRGNLASGMYVCVGVCFCASVGGACVS